ncbi:MAG TPA: hypothetical protein VLF71_05920 [Candidatus Saccharimonadales bacterium]|nr:hypothetical protein [Candidatus Saccharimonadales bacterium]
MPETAGQVLEFYSSYAGSRLLAMPRNSYDSETHHDLSSRGLPVLARYGDNPSQDVDLLLIPPGTWPLGSRLHIVRRDLQLYSRLLWMVGQSQRQQYDRGMGVVVASGDLRAIDHFAFTPDLRSTTGQELSLLPPYMIGPEGTPEMFAETISRELAESGEFSEHELAYLREAVTQGTEAPRAVDDVG